MKDTDVYNESLIRGFLMAWHHHLCVDKGQVANDSAERLLMRRKLL